MPKPRKHHYPPGTVVGRLTVTGEVMRPRSDGRNRRHIVCMCECGKRVEVLPSNVGSGDTQSCGCFQRERASEANTTHGGSDRSPGSLYNVWRGMRRRCNSPSAHNYKWYGGKGVSIEWETFADFEAWATDSGYAVGRQLDRIDSNDNYGPNNCWWSAPGDNMARAHLNIDDEVDRMIIQHAIDNGLEYSDVLNQAAVAYLAKGGVG